MYVPIGDSSSFVHYFCVRTKCLHPVSIEKSVNCQSEAKSPRTDIVTKRRLGVQRLVSMKFCLPMPPKKQKKLSAVRKKGVHLPHTLLLGLQRIGFLLKPLFPTLYLHAHGLISGDTTTD